MNKLTKNGTQKILDVYNAVFKGMRALHGTSETMQAASGTCTLLKGHVQYQPPRTGEGTKLGSDKLAIMSRCRVASISLISRGKGRQTRTVRAATQFQNTQCYVSNLDVCTSYYSCSYRGVIRSQHAGQSA